MRLSLPSFGKIGYTFDSFFVVQLRHSAVAFASEFVFDLHIALLAALKINLTMAGQ